MGDLLFVTPQCHCGFTGAYLANSYIKFLETRAEYSHSSRIKTVLSATCLPAFAGSRCQGCNSCNAITLNWKISIFDASLGQLIDKLKVKLTPHWVSVLVRPDKLFVFWKAAPYHWFNQHHFLAGVKLKACLDQRIQLPGPHYQTRFPSEKGKHKILPSLRSKVTTATPRKWGG